MRYWTLRLLTKVDDETTNGAVPVARVVVSCPLILMVEMLERAPLLMIKLLIVLVLVGAVMAPVVLTWNWEVEPTLQAAAGLVKPMPNL